MSNKIKPKSYLFRKVLATLLSLGVFLSLLVAGFAFKKIYAMIENRPTLDFKQLETSESSLLYDAYNQVFAEIGSKLSDNIHYDELPTSLIDAFISIEDSRFFDHNGFDVSRFFKAAIDGLPKMLSGQGFGGGGSTITMQTIKNSFFVTDEANAATTIERKAQEISLALDLEEVADKKTILEYYLNKINFGTPKSRGLAKAAEYYFGKSVKELTLSESAYLAGVINAPNLNNAYRNIDFATQRRNEVLDLMAFHGYISPQENKLAKSVKLENQLVGEEKYVGDVQKYQQYIDVVLDELQYDFGINPYIGGLKIYTALNPKQQDIIEAIQHNQYGGFEDNLIQGAFVSLNNQTGELNALGGGRYLSEKRVQRGLNLAYSEKRQPGSVLKPIFPYALAFEKLGYSTMHTLKDTPYAYRGSPAFVNNYTRKFAGDVELRDAIVSSLNIPALRTVDDLIDTLGYQPIVTYLNNIGFDKIVLPSTQLSDQERQAGFHHFNSGYTIGSSTFDVTPVEVAGAHAMVFNQGNYIKPHTILEVEIPGQPSLKPKYLSTQALTPGAAYMTAEMMKAAVDAEIGTAATKLKRSYPVYAKSGTSDYGDDFTAYGIPDGATKDSWIAASTSNYTIVGWTGYTRNVIDGQGYYIKNPLKSGNDLAYLCGLLLDNTLDFSSPALLTKPSDVEQITAVRGIYNKMNDGTYRYFQPTENMDDHYITNAYIKKDFASLLTMEKMDLPTLESQEVKASKSLLDDIQLDIQLSAYQSDSTSDNTSSDEESDDRNTYIATATNSLGEKVSARVRRIFDPSWIHGGLDYGTEVKENGFIIKSDFGSSPNKVINLSPFISSPSIDVCSFYTWASNHNARSNEVCQQVSLENLSTSTSPSQQAQDNHYQDLVNLDVTEAANKLEADGVSSILYETMTPQRADQIRKVYKVSRGNYYSSSAYTLHYYDGDLDALTAYIGRQVGLLLDNNPYPTILKLQGNIHDRNAIIDSIQVNGQNPRGLRMSDVSTGSPIIVTIQTR